MRTLESPEDYLAMDGESEDYKLVRDLDFGGFTLSNEEVNFYGNLYGQGFTIKNLNIDNTGTAVLPQDAGLFGRFSGNIFNLRLENITANGFFSDNEFEREKSYAGAIAANASGATFVNVHVRNSTIFAKSFSYATRSFSAPLGIGAAGGLSGNGGTAIRCSVKGCTIKGRSEVGGFIARDGDVRDCYAVDNEIVVDYGPDGDDVYDPDWRAAGIGISASLVSNYNAENTFVSNTFSGPSQYTTYAGLGISLRTSSSGEMNAYFNNDHGYDAFKHLWPFGSGIGGNGVGLPESEMKGEGVREKMSNLDFEDVYYTRGSMFPQIRSSFRTSDQIFISGEGAVLLPETNSLADEFSNNQSPADFITQEGVPVVTDKNSIPEQISTDYPDEPL